MLTESRYAGEFMLSEASGMRSRDVGVVDQSQTLVAGQVVGQVSVGALSAAAAALGTNVGNPTFGAITVAAGTTAGAFTVEMDDATHFVVSEPGGSEVGHGTTGVAFSGGGVGFTLTAGGTACAPADSFTITVSAAAAANAGRYVAVNPTATDGSQNAVAVLWDAVTTAAGVTAKALLIKRSAEVRAVWLTWPVGATLNQIAAWTAQLATAGIIARS